MRIDRPRAIVYIRGGVAQYTTSNHPDIEIMVIDYDIDAGNPENNHDQDGYECNKWSRVDNIDPELVKKEFDDLN